MHPHCGDRDCDATECYAAGCGFTYGTCGRVSTRYSRPPVERLDLLPGTNKRWFKPVTTIGTFVEGAVWLRKPVRQGWAFNEAVNRPSWPDTELHAMWCVLQEILEFR